VSVLHLANGSSVTSLIERAGIPGDLMLWCDVLHEGPVPGDILDSDLRKVRAAYLAGTSSGPGFDQLLAELTSRDDAVAHRASRDEVILWFEHDLFDQLNLIQLLHELSKPPKPSTPVSLVSVDRFPGRRTFKGLGELTPEELASLLGQRQPVSELHMELGRQAWSAFRASNPQRIEVFLQQDLSVLPFLGAALRRHLEEFPSVSNGLSRTEQRLLELASGPPIEIGDAFMRLHDSESCFYVGDTSFLRIVRELASLSPPLLALDGDDPSAEGLPRASIALTPAGQTVLFGQADRVRDWGIDRWLGGVHLDWRGPLWRWDHGLERLIIA
jgi:hypothetical protein